MDIPIHARNDVPYLTTEQMIEVDRAMMEDNRIELIQMMENAGRNLAHLARRRFLDGHPAGKQIVVLTGTGGNGGGALVCARRLSNWGAKVRVYTTSGTVFDPAIRATATMTLALPKEGLRTPGVAANVGELYLADISVPPGIYAEPALQLEVGTIFAQSDIIRLSHENENL